MGEPSLGQNSTYMLQRYRNTQVGENIHWFYFVYNENLLEKMCIFCEMYINVQIYAWIYYVPILFQIRNITDKLFHNFPNQISLIITCVRQIAALINVFVSEQFGSRPIRYGRITGRENWMKFSRLPGRIIVDMSIRLLYQNTLHSLFKRLCIKLCYLPK